MIISAAIFIQKLPLAIILRIKMVLPKAKLNLLMRKKERVVQFRTTNNNAPFNNSPPRNNVPANSNNSAMAIAPPSSSYLKVNQSSNPPSNFQSPSNN